MNEEEFVKDWEKRRQKGYTNYLVSNSMQFTISFMVVNYLYKVIIFLVKNKNNFWCSISQLNTIFDPIEIAIFFIGINLGGACIANTLWKKYEKRYTTLTKKVM